MEAEVTSPSRMESRRPHGEFIMFDQQFGVEWYNIFRVTFVIGHILVVYSLIDIVTGAVPIWTLLLDIVLIYTAGLGITVGCHRYWTHKTFKANLPLQVILMLMQTLAFQFTIYKWCLTHRIHHKYTDTNADPHNSNRGFWFSHIGWLINPKHPEVQKKIDTFQMLDLQKDPVVRFQNKHYWILALVISLILPTLVYRWIFAITWEQCFMANVRRYLMQLHITFSVNSVAHRWGEKPYDSNLSSVDNIAVSFLTTGEGWHNYHHSFPWDYKSAEFGWKVNLSTVFIDFFAWLGWAYEMKTVSHEMILQRRLRTGDKKRSRKTASKSHSAHKTTDDTLWGWDDERMSCDLRQVTQILHKLVKSR